MATLHTVTIATKTPVSLEMASHVQTAIRGLVDGLEVAATKVEDDKTGAALLATIATLKFLRVLPLRPHLWAPLEEAVDILAQKLNARTISKQTEDKVLKSIAVSLQLEAGAKLRDALKKVVGRDPGASQKLKDFRNNMLGKNTPKGAKDRYHELRRTFFNTLPPRSALELAFFMCRASEGKKS